MKVEFVKECVKRLEEKGIDPKSVTIGYLKSMYMMENMDRELELISKKYLNNEKVLMVNTGRAA